MYIVKDDIFFDKILFVVTLDRCLKLFVSTFDAV